MLTFGILDPAIQNITWCSKEMPGGAMANFNLSGGFDCVSRAGFIAYAVVIDPTVLLRSAEQIGLYERTETMLDEHPFWHSGNSLNLGRKLRKLFRLAGQSSAQGAEEFSRSIDDEVPWILLKELTGDRYPPATVSASAKRRILTRVLEIVNDPDEIPISVTELCDRVGTSASTLNRLFLAEYGVSPKSYIRSRCLSAVRDALACAPPGILVSDVANYWGFWHMGQFAADYRKMFGELPSATMSKAI
jgi:AraC-like DNA-binding protein